MVDKATNAHAGSDGKKKTPATPRNGRNSGTLLEPGEIVTAAEFQRRAEISRYTFARMQKNGLKVRRDGNQVFVKYDDFAKYVDGLSA